jgi:hypothetical protein
MHYNGHRESTYVTVNRRKNVAKHLSGACRIRVLQYLYRVLLTVASVRKARRGGDQCPGFFDSGQPESLSHDWSARMAKALPKLEK